jgi:hypothetical protein
MVLLVSHAVVATQVMGFDDQVGVFLRGVAGGYWWRQPARRPVAIQHLAYVAEVDAIALEHLD